MGDNNPEPKDVFKILIATDNHLGYSERDPIRRDDSFEAFEEILALAKQNEVDFLLLGGDLFHDNMPSRSTLHRTMEILRKYCFGDNKPAEFQILSDETIHFSKLPWANISDPNLKISLPVFSIHGNHDDPGEGSLATLDLLHLTSLVNYFGKTDLADQISVHPLILRKGASHIAIYGLGNIRDERLGRLFSQNAVNFVAPPLQHHFSHSRRSNLTEDFSERSTYSDTDYIKEETNSSPQKAKKSENNSSNHQKTNSNQSNSNGLNSTHPNMQVDIKSETHVLNDDRETQLVDEQQQQQQEEQDENSNELFRILVLHQNRVAHTAKSFVPESCLDSFDFVLWGHEHESIVVDDSRVMNGTYISQPGSSVATALSEGEAVQKHVAILEIFKSNFRVTPIPLKTVRPFVIRDVDLQASSIPKSLPETDLVQAISDYLATIVDNILEEIKRETFVEDVNCSLGQSIGSQHQKSFTFANQKLPLIRLRVNYTGYVAINSKRFGQRFVQKVANPGDILLFMRSTRKNTNDQQQAMRSAKSRSEAENLLELAPGNTNIEDMLDSLLSKELTASLELYNADSLTRALHSYVQKDDKKCLTDAFEGHLGNVRSHIMKQVAFIPDPMIVSEFVKEFNTTIAAKEQIDGKSNASPVKAETPQPLVAAQFHSTKSSTPSKVILSKNNAYIDPEDAFGDFPDNEETDWSMEVVSRNNNQDDMAFGSPEPISSEKRKRSYSKRTATPSASLDIDMGSYNESTPKSTPKPRASRGSTKRTGAKASGKKSSASVSNSPSSTPTSSQSTFGLVRRSANIEETKANIIAKVGGLDPEMIEIIDSDTDSGEDVLKDIFLPPAPKRSKYFDQDNTSTDFGMNLDSQAASLTPQTTPKSSTKSSSSLSSQKKSSKTPSQSKLPQSKVNPTAVTLDDDMLDEEPDQEGHTSFGSPQASGASKWARR